MNREEAKKLLPIIQAFTEGMDIQIKVDGEWHYCKLPSFNAKPEDYRIKPEPIKIRYRRYLWKDLSGKYLINTAANHYVIDEGDETFIKWIDPDWVEYAYTPE